MIERINIYHQSKLSEFDNKVINDVKNWKTKHKNIFVLSIVKYNITKPILRIKTNEEILEIGIDESVNIKKLLNIYNLSKRNIFRKIWTILNNR